jgi:hypothetical protein
MKTKFTYFNKYTIYKFSTLDNPNIKKKPFSQNSLTFEKVFEILEKIGSVPKLSESNIRSKYCPVCPKPHNDDPTNMNTFLVNRDLSFACFRCGEKGKFLFLLKRLSRTENLPSEYKTFYSDYSSFTENEDITTVVRKRRKPVIDGKEEITIYENKSEPIESPKAEAEIHKGYIPIQTGYKLSLSNTTLVYEMARRYNLLEHSICSPIKNYVENIRKLKMDTLRFFKVGFSFERFKNNDLNVIELPCVTFPMFYPLSNESIFSVDKKSVGEENYKLFDCDKFYLSKMKIRAITKELKHFQKIDPPGALTWYDYIT